MISFHSGDLQSPPAASILEEFQCTAKRVEERLRRMVLEDKAVGPTRTRPGG